MDKIPLDEFTDKFQRLKHETNQDWQRYAPKDIAPDLFLFPDNLMK